MNEDANARCNISTRPREHMKVVAETLDRSPHWITKQAMLMKS
ncbi:hypothetical protein [Pseudomonas chlororaphis]